jgi:hypothetical protein
VLRAVDVLPSLELEWSHFIVLSEHHLPLAPPDEVASRLPPGQCLIPYTKFSDMPPSGQLDVRHRFEMHYMELRGVGCFVQNHSRIEESFYEKMFHSDNWFVLSPAACARLRDRDEDAHLIAHLASSVQPDEILVPTMLLGYPRGYNLDIVPQNASFIARPFVGGATGQTFTEENFHAAVEEHYLFIRKRPHELPQSVRQYLQEHTGLDHVAYRSLKDLAVTLQAEANLPIYRNDFITNFISFANHCVNITVEDLSRSGFDHVPPLYMLFSSPSWHKDVKIALLSENFFDFKIALIWFNAPRQFLEPIKIGDFSASVMRVRVYGLFLSSREVFIEGEPNGGFLSVAGLADLAKVEGEITVRLAYAAAFSEALLEHERRVADVVAEEPAL